LLPAGFFLGGIGHGEGEPSFVILPAPIDARLLLIAVALIAWSATDAQKE
jgi:hypothetical protein